MSVKKMTLFFIFITATACSNNNESLLLKYSEIKCSYMSIIVKKDSALQQELESPKLRVQNLKAEYAILTAPYDKKIKAINNNMFKAYQNYVKKVKMISANHENLYGHKITPDYLNNIDILEKEKLKVNDRYQKQVDGLVNQKQTNSLCREKERQIKQIEGKIDSIASDINSRYSSKIVELQRQLNAVNKELDNVNKELTPDKQEIFSKKRERIKANPCKTL